VTIATADEFRAYVREMITAMPDPGPGPVVDKVLSNISAKEAKVALEVTLRDYVRELINEAARSARREPVLHHGDDGRVFVSKMVAASWLERTLATQLHAGDRWRFLRDCGVTDLEAAAVSRESQADALRVEADRWRRLAAALAEHSCAIVAELPEQTLREILGGTP